MVVCCRYDDGENGFCSHGRIFILITVLSRPVSMYGRSSMPCVTRAWLIAVANLLMMCSVFAASVALFMRARIMSSFMPFGFLL